MRKTSLLIGSTILCAFILIFYTSAQIGAKTSKRVALVIGIDAYSSLKILANPVRDAHAIAALFGKHGFTVAHHSNLDHTGFKKALEDFTKLAKGADEAIIFYAGHGMTALRNKRLANVLAPTNATISCETRTATNTVTMAQMMKTIEGVPKQVVLFDSCRDDPIRNCQSNALTATLQGFQPARMMVPQASVAKPRGAGGRGFIALAPMKQEAKKPASSILIAYSTDLGAAASDGEPGQHSPFATALLAELNAGPQVPVRKILDQTSTRVASLGQRPWVVTKGGEPEMCLRGRDCKFSKVIDAKRLLNRSLFLAKQSEQYAKNYDYITAGLLALESMGAREDFRTDLPRSDNAVSHLEYAYRNAREVAVLRLPKGALRAKFLPDGKRFMTWGKENFISIWDVKTRKHLFDLKGHQSRIVHTVIVSADGKFIAAASPPQLSYLPPIKDKTVKIWNAKTGKLIHTLPDNGNSVAGIKFNRSSTRLARFSVNKAAKIVAQIWDLRKPRLITTLIGAEAVHFAPGRSSKKPKRLGKKRRRIVMRLKSDFRSSKKRYISYDNSSHRLRVHSVATKKLIQTMEGDFRWTAPFFPLDRSSSRVAGISAIDRTVVVWDVESGRRLALLKGDLQRGFIGHVDISPDGQFILTMTTYGREVRLWRIAPKLKTIQLQGNGKRILSMDLSSDGKHIVTSSTDMTARIWETETGKQIKVFKGGQIQIEYALFSPNGQLLLTVPSKGEAKIWNAYSGKVIASLQGLEGRIKSLEFSPDSKRLVAGTFQKRAYLWDVSSGRLIAELKGHTDQVRMVKFSRNGKSIVSSISTSPGKSSVWLWDGLNGRKIAKFRGHSDRGLELDDAAISHDRRFVAIASDDGSVAILNLQNQRKHLVLQGDGSLIGHLGFSPDAKYLATTHWNRKLKERSVKVWNIETASLAYKLVSKHGSYKIDFDHQSSKLVAYSDRFIGVWALKTGKNILTLDNFREFEISSVRFSPNGDKLLLLSREIPWQPVQVWDVHTGKKIARLQYSGVKPWRLVFSKNNKFIITDPSRLGGIDNITLWERPLRETDLRREFIEMTPRCLTLAQKKALSINPEPHRWCITGAGREKTPRVEWHGKWPYHTKAWKDWLVARDQGKNPPLPGRAIAAIRR